MFVYFCHSVFNTVSCSIRYVYEIGMAGVDWFCLNIAQVKFSGVQEQMCACPWAVWVRAKSLTVGWSYFDYSSTIRLQDLWKHAPLGCHNATHSLSPSAVTTTLTRPAVCVPFCREVKNMPVSLIQRPPDFTTFQQQHSYAMPQTAQHLVRAYVLLLLTGIVDHFNII